MRTLAVPLLAILFSYLTISARADLYFPGYTGPIDYTLLGTKWEPGPNSASSGPFGTPGGATWSVMAAGFGDVSTFDTGHGSSLTTSFFGLTTSDELAMIDATLDTWAAVSGFTNLGMVGDGGVGFGAGPGCLGWPSR